MAYSTEKSLKEHGDKVTPEVRAEIERGISELREALKGDDGDIIKKKSDLLMESSQKMGEAIYKNAADQAGAAGAGSAAPEAQSDRATGDAPKKDDDVIDAEYEVKE